MNGKPCTCWIGPVALHDGHCCWNHYDPDRNRVTCGHDTAGMRLFREAQRARSAVQLELGAVS